MSENTGWDVEPEIGMGATQSVGSDSYAYTIVDVSDQTVTFQLTNRWDQDQFIDFATGKKTYKYKTMEVTWPKYIWVSRDSEKSKGEMKNYGDKVDYDYKSNFNAEYAEKYILHKDGRYHQASTKFNPTTKRYEYGNTTQKSNRTIGIGFRRTHWDPSF